MRPAIHDSTTTTRQRVRNVTVATAVGLSLMLGGAVAAPALESVNATGKATTVAQRPVAPARVAPARRGTGTAIDINLSRQWATLYRSGRRVASFPISSGKAGWRTPTGTYRVYRKQSGWRRSRLGLMWRPAYFRGGYAIHGSRSVPRYAASHGCVRVTMRRMAWLSGNLPIGATVRVHY